MPDHVRARPLNDEEVTKHRTFRRSGKSERFRLAESVTGAASSQVFEATSSALYSGAGDRICEIKADKV